MHLMPDVVLGGITIMSFPRTERGRPRRPGSGDVQEGMQDSLLALHPEINVTYRWTRLVSLALTAAAVTKPHLFLDVMIAF